MLNILGYFIFSGLEFFAITMLMLSMFSFNIKYYKKEIATTTITTTLLSYVLVILNLDSYIMFVMIITFFILFKFLYRGTIKRSIVVAVMGYILFIGIQVALALLAKKMNYLTTDDMTNPYSYKAYIFQSLDSTIMLMTAAHIHFFSGGFGFSLKSKSLRVKKLVYFAIFSAIVASIGLFSFVQFHHMYLLVSAFAVILLSVVILMILSIRQDHVEFSHVDNKCGLNISREEV
jgi:hypothetical protein